MICTSSRVSLRLTALISSRTVFGRGLGAAGFGRAGSRLAGGGSSGTDSDGPARTRTAVEPKSLVGPEAARPSAALWPWDKKESGVCWPPSVCSCCSVRCEVVKGDESLRSGSPELASRWTEKLVWGERAGSSSAAGWTGGGVFGRKCNLKLREGF